MLAFTIEFSNNNLTFSMTFSSTNVPKAPLPIQQHPTRRIYNLKVESYLKGICRFVHSPSSEWHFMKYEK